MSGLAKYVEINIENLTLAPWNYKTDDDRLQAKLVANMKRNGQVENLIVREMDGGVYEVINGNHRLKAMLELGYENVVCCNLGKISDAKAKRIAVETNETKFGTDSIKLAQTIRDMGDEFEVEDLLESLPFQKSELENFDGLLNFDWDAFSTDPGAIPDEEGSHPDDSDPEKTSVETKRKVTCPHCGKSFEIEG